MKTCFILGGFYFASLIKRLKHLYSYLELVPIVQICVGFMVGVVLGWAGTWQVWAALLMLLFVVVRRTKILLVVFLVIGICFVRIRYNLDEFANYYGQSVAGSFVVEDVTRGEFSQTVILSTPKLPAKLVARLPTFPRLSIGNTINANFKAENLANFDGDYADYFRSTGVFFNSSSDAVVLLENIDSPNALLGKIKQTMQSIYSEFLSADVAKLVSAIVLNTDIEKTTDLSRSIRSSGLVHLVYASGINVWLITSCLFLTAGLLPRKLLTILAVMVIAFYTVFIGGNAWSIWRAALMTGISLVLILWGKSLSIYLRLLYANTIIFIFMPLAWMNIGWQISQLAVLSILLLAPKLATHLPQKWRRSWLLQEFLSGVCAFFAIYPLLIPIAPDLNFLSTFGSLILFPFVLLLTMLAVLASLVFPLWIGLAQVIFFAMDCLGRFVLLIIKVVEVITQNFPWQPIYTVGLVLLVLALWLIADMREVFNLLRNSNEA